MTAQKTGAAPDVAIVGGGILGCALAYDLAGHGLSVVLLERGQLAREASWASAGIISPPTPAYGSRADLGLLGYRRYPGLIDEIEAVTGIATGRMRSGETMTGHTDDEAILRETLEWQRAQGLNAEWLDDQSLHEREPALREEISVGVHTPDTISVRLDKMSLALARAAELRGAIIREFVQVLGIEVRGGRATGIRMPSGSRPAGAVVIAAGAWSRTLGDSLDFDIPSRPVKGQMLAVANAPIPIRSIIAGGGGYFVPRADGTVAVGATEEPDAGWDTAVTPAGVAWLTDLIDRVVPSLNQGRLDATWAGLRPGSIDGELIVGKLPHLENVWVATGHFRSGALLGPATSQLLAASIAGGVVDERLKAFGLERFV